MTHMAVIQVTPEHLNAEAERLRQYKAQHDEEMDKLRLLVQSTNAVWSGEAQSAYVSAFESADYLIRGVGQLLEAYAALMQSAATQMQQADNQASIQLRNV